MSHRRCCCGEAEPPTPGEPCGFSVCDTSYLMQLEADRTSNLFPGETFEHVSISMVMARSTTPETRYCCGLPTNTCNCQAGLPGCVNASVTVSGTPPPGQPALPNWNTVAGQFGCNSTGIFPLELVMDLNIWLGADGAPPVFGCTFGAITLLLRQTLGPLNGPWIPNFCPPGFVPENGSNIGQSLQLASVSFS